ncbi:MAG: methyltransferase [Hyphomicrobiaceae bacterium]|nr:methyltransferase [Hyphomicrobiaceae bacterium]
MSNPAAGFGSRPATRGQEVPNGDAAPRTGLRARVADRLAQLRDKLLLDQRFHDAVFRIPGIRGLARRETRALFDICAGFVYTQVLLACVRLGLFPMLRDGPLTAAEISARTGLPAASVERLAAAAVSLRLLSRRSGGRIGLGTLGAAIAKDGSIAAMVEHHATLYVDLYDPVALLGSNKPKTAMSAYWPYTNVDRPAALSDGDVASYTALMSTSQRMIAAEVVAAYDFTRHQRLLDIGGGDGTFIATVAGAAPGLSMTLFDLPAVAAIAQKRFEADGIGSRATAVGGDFYRDTLPAGADVVTLVRVLFDHDDTSAVAILKAARAAMAPEATLVIAEPMSGARGAGPVMDAYFSFYLLAMGKGRSRSVNDFMRLLRATGFGDCRCVEPRNPLLVSLITALPTNMAEIL